jgi:hypothetical protein
VVGADGKKTSKVLPDGLFTTFAGFEDVTKITIKDAGGATVRGYDTDFCPNTYNTSRTRRDAPAENPYPQECAGDNHRPGQSFEVTDLPNGTYFIETPANPDNKLAELNTRNNSSLRKIVLGGTPEKRTLRVPAVHGIEG